MMPLIKGAPCEKLMIIKPLLLNFHKRKRNEDKNKTYRSTIYEEDT